MNRSGRVQSAREFEGEELSGRSGKRPAMQPDIRQQAETRGYRIMRRPPPTPDIPTHGITASPITMNDFSGAVKVTPGNQFPVSGGATILYPVLAIPQNKNRKKFVLHNPGFNTNTMYFSYKQQPGSLYTLYVGGFWVEQGNDVSRDDIYVWCDIAQGFSASEGVRDIADETY